MSWRRSASVTPMSFLTFGRGFLPNNTDVRADSFGTMASAHVRTSHHRRPLPLRPRPARRRPAPAPARAHAAADGAPALLQRQPRGGLVFDARPVHRNDVVLAGQPLGQLVPVVTASRFAL